jgi:hypothetical protein
MGPLAPPPGRAVLATSACSACHAIALRNRPQFARGVGQSGTKCPCGKALPSR